MRLKFGMANELLDYSESIEDLYKKRGISYSDDTTTRIAQTSEEAGKMFKLSEVQADYIYVALRALTAEVPNNNGDLFRLAELERVDEATNQPVYKSFINKGVYKNHESDKVENSIGYIVDAELIKNADDPHIQIIIAIDSIKAPDISRGVATGRLRAWSMGCSIKYSLCTYCGKKVADDTDLCSHLKNYRGQRYGGVIVAEELHGVQFIEISSVSVPADPKAQLLYRVAEDKTAQQVLPEYAKGDTVYVRTPRGTIKAEITGKSKDGYTVKFCEGKNAYYDELDNKIPKEKILSKRTENTRFHNLRISEGNIKRFCEHCGSSLKVGQETPLGIGAPTTPAQPPAPSSVLPTSTVTPAEPLGVGAPMAAPPASNMDALQRWLGKVQLSEGEKKDAVDLIENSGKQARDLNLEDLKRLKIAEDGKLIIKE